MYSDSKLLLIIAISISHALAEQTLGEAFDHSRNYSARETSGSKSKYLDLKVLLNCYSNTRNIYHILYTTITNIKFKCV